VAAAAGIAHFFFSFLLFARFASTPLFAEQNADAFSGNRLIDDETLARFRLGLAVKIVKIDRR
ncbi:MAG: hypothetical protein IJE97_06555, partial [Thermoguttaceae bacterium]|nr:hypothetical protein [Thermoguttaceae bacterium]